MNSQSINIKINFHKFLLLCSNSFEFKGKLEIGNNSAAEFDTKFINFIELLLKFYKNLLVESNFVKSSAILITLESNSADEILPITNFPVNLEELLY